MTSTEPEERTPEDAYSERRRFEKYHAMQTLLLRVSHSHNAFSDEARRLLSGEFGDPSFPVEPGATPLPSKEQVQRFSGWGIAMMQNKPVTEYVLASDYDVVLAENERLRAVLNSIANNSCCTPCQEAANVARVALGRPTLYIQPVETSARTNQGDSGCRMPGDDPPCPDCGKELHKVRNPAGSMLNDDQFDAVRAGDWYCTHCPSNGRGNSSYRYFWEREVRRAVKTSAGGAS